MRRYWRLTRLFVVALAYTVFLDIAARLRPEEERALYRARHQQKGCSMLARILRVEVELRGTLPEGGALLAVSNHIGMLDAIALASQMPIAFVGKAEIKSWPFLGWVTRTFGVVFVQRGRRTQTADFVEDVRYHLRHGVRVLVFPEGTTNSRWRLLPFKTGTFEAVADMGDGAVLPLYLFVRSVDGEPAAGLVRKRVIWADENQPFADHGWKLLERDRIVVELHVGEPQPTAGRDRKVLAALLHERVSALRDQAVAAAPFLPEVSELLVAPPHAERAPATASERASTARN